MGERGKEREREREREGRERERKAGIQVGNVVEKREDRETDNEGKGTWERKAK